MEPLSYEGFKALALCGKRAFHLEQREAYNVAAEDEPFGRWLRGEPDDYAWHQDWLGFIRQATAAGVAVQRVRLASHPAYQLHPLGSGRLLPQHRSGRGHPLLAAPPHRRHHAARRGLLAAG
jgi:hypothetical protein